LARAVGGEGVFVANRPLARASRPDVVFLARQVAGRIGAASRFGTGPSLADIAFDDDCGKDQHNGNPDEQFN